MKVTLINLLLLLILPISQAYAGRVKVESVSWKCEQTLDVYTQKQLLKLASDYENMDDVKVFIRESLQDLGLRNVSYSMNYTEGAGYSLHFLFSIHPKITYIKVVGAIPSNVNKSLFLLKEGTFLLPGSRESSIERLKKAIMVKGYPDVSVEIGSSINPAGAELLYRVNLGKPTTLEYIATAGGDRFVNDFYKKMFAPLIGKTIDMSVILEKKDEADFLLRSYGYLSLRSILTRSESSHIIKIRILDSNPYIFYFKGNSRFSTFVLKKELRNRIISADQNIIQGLIVKIVSEMYKKAGYYKTQIKVLKQKYQELENGQKPIRYNIEVVEGERVRIARRLYRGNSKVSDKELESFFHEKSNSLASSDYLDEHLYEDFPEYLKKFYGEKGYLLSKFKMRIPYIEKDKALNVKERNVEFIISEGARSVIKKIKIRGVNGEKLDEEDLFNLMTSKTNHPLNPYVLEDDIETVAKYFKFKGYYKVKVVNEGNLDLVTYSKDAREVELKFIVERGPLYKYSNTFIFGNQKTKDKLILKRLSLKKGAVITANIINDFKKRLFALGLFSSVTVTPREAFLKERVEGAPVDVDLIVRVREFDYGSVELIPGLRTDTGVKLGFNIGYGNLSGMGRSVRFKSEINQRLSYSNFDEARNAEDSKFLEYDFNLSYTELDVFKTDIYYLAEFGAKKRRYYAFDAEIYRVANKFDYNFSRRLGATLSHQFEEIRQEQGSTSTDNGEFRIGSLIPTLSYDWRNSLSNTTSGGLNSFSVEWASPLWFSQDKADLKIEFVKYILRNRFYLPFRGGALALAWTAGIQKNLSDNGYIPGIKTFRLGGADIVRGYSDEEINKLSNGSDISQFQITDTAYLNSMKVEPRLFLNKNVMLGAFWDAGRVSANSDQFFSLRQSVGLSLKILTPVGSINFDYGHKLKRETDAFGTVESPGRFHLSIGFL